MENFEFFLITPTGGRCVSRNLGLNAWLMKRTCYMRESYFGLVIKTQKVVAIFHRFAEAIYFSWFVPHRETLGMPLHCWNKGIFSSEDNRNRVEEHRADSGENSIIKL